MIKKILLSACLGTLPFTSHAANITWVTDNNTQGTATEDNTGVGPYADIGFMNLLTAAGHTVTRYNPPANNALPAGDITALNSADLVILGRGVGSGAFDLAAETNVWNTQITKPLMSTNAYLSRGNRLGWFGIGSVGATVNNSPIDLSLAVLGAGFQSAANFANPSDPVSSYIIGSAAMSGNDTVNSLYESIMTAQGTDQGLSVLQPVLNSTGTPSTTTSTAPVAGANIISTLTAPGFVGSVNIMSLPTGTTLAGTSAGQVTSGYRLMFLAGNREPITPENQLGDAGWENLTPDGEQMFVRAVTLALNNGVVPIPEPSTSVLAGLLGMLGLCFRRRR